MLFIYSKVVTILKTKWHVNNKRIRKMLYIIKIESTPVLPKMSFAWYGYIYRFYLKMQVSAGAGTSLLNLVISA
jgi:hypothetical protein